MGIVRRIIGTTNMPFYISPPPRNPLASVLGALVGVIVLVAAFMLGFVVLLVVAGLGLLAGLGMFIRIKWAQYQLRKQGFDPLCGAPPSNGIRPDQRDSLEVEYTVISTERDE